LFVLIGLGWLGFTFVDLLGGLLGDCFDNQWCQGRKSISFELAFWRGLCVGILIVLSYRYFRGKSDV
jgi:hypothetical protein